MIQSDMIGNYAVIGSVKGNEIRVISGQSYDKTGFSFSFRGLSFTGCTKYSSISSASLEIVLLPLVVLLILASLMTLGGKTFGYFEQC